MKRSLLMGLLWVCITAYSQAPEKKTLLVDETEIVKSGDSKFRVITTNDTISHKIMVAYKNTLMLSYSAFKRVDNRRKDTYWEQSFYFDNKDYNRVVAYIKGGFK